MEEEVTKLETLHIVGKSDTFFTPTVHFNAESGVCELSGESYLEDTWEFYDRLLSWLRDYMDKIKKPIVFNFKLTYFNTSSSKGILDIVKLLKNYEDAGGGVTANWHYPEDDIDNLEEAEDFIADTDLEMNLIAY